MKIGHKKIGKGNPVFIVAEAGINHNGDIDIAKKMIEMASKCHADAIKFQTIFPEELFSKKLNPDWYGMIEQWSFSKKQHQELQKHAQKNNIEFFSTPVGKKSSKLLRDIKVNCIKIASGELTNHELIRNVSKSNIPMIVSTGMSNISEIADVVKIIKEDHTPFALLHCNSSYPSPVEDVNLSTIPYLNQIFDVPIGYSDHTLGNDVCVAAVSLGACIIEKHFTLDKKMDGPDQKLSSDISEFSELVKRIRIVEKSLGKHRTGPTKSEKKFVDVMRKSVSASIDIKIGTKIKKSMLTSIRPGTGIPSNMIDNLVGMQPVRKIEKGTILTWDMF